MDKEETKQLAALNQRVIDLAADVTEIKITMQDFIKASDTKFITRLEGKTAAWIIGLALTIVGLISAFKKSG